MRLADVTPAQRRDLRDGKTVQLTLKDGAKINVTPWMVHHARDIIAAGGQVTILPEIIGEGRMEEVRLG